MQRQFNPILTCSVLLGFLASGGQALAREQEELHTVESRHLGLASDFLAWASLADLPEGVLLRCDGREATRQSGFFSRASLEQSLRTMEAR